MPSPAVVLDGLTAERSSFDRPAVIRAVAQGAAFGAPVGTAERHADRVMVDERVVPLGDSSSYSTTEQIEIESRLLSGAMARRDAGVAKVANEVIRSVLAARPQLSPEQRKMVKATCGDGAGVSVVVGHAGSGKTTALEAARAAWATSGVEVNGCALARRAGAELEAGAAIRAFSVAHLIHGLDRGTWSMPVGSVLVVDEAGMVGTRHLHRLATEAERTDSKLVLVGDPAQLPEIDAGGAFAELSRALSAVTLTKNQRQRDPIDRQVALALRAGRAEEAMATLHRTRRLVTAATPDDLRIAMVGDWARATAAGNDALMLAPRLVDAEILNRAARAVLRDQGALGSDAFVVDGRGFAVGDRVLTLRNNARLGVWNGSRGTVIAVDRSTHSLTMRVDVSGRLVNLLGSYVEAGWVGHAYASTIHKAQGLTVDKAMLWGDRHVFAEAGYTAMTRGRDANTFYVVAPDPDAERCSPEFDKDQRSDEVARSLAASRAKTMALTQDPDAKEVARLVPLGIGPLRARRQELIRCRGVGRGDARDAATLRVLNKALDIHIRRAENWLRHDLPAEWEAALGARPDSPRDRAKWDGAIRSSAHHLVVHGVERDSRAEGIEALLGERPMSESAARSWDRAASQVQGAAHGVGVGHLGRDGGTEL